MMDFDFEERIDSFSELAKWILLELKDNRLDDDSN